MNTIQENSYVVFRDSKGKEWLRKIIPGESLHTHKGFINFDDIIGKEYGSIISILNDDLLLMHPRHEQYTRTMKHGTNIIYDADAIAMISSAGVGPGDSVLEIGTGSGGMTYFLAFYCTKNVSKGKVVTIDLRTEHSAIARENLERVQLADRVDFRVGDITDSNVLPEKEFFDGAFIDMPTPYNLLSPVKKAIKCGASIMVFLPNWYQVEQTIAQAQELELTVINVFETNRRPMDVKPAKHVMRPVFRALVYSGIIIHLIKTQRVEVVINEKRD